MRRKESRKGETKTGTKARTEAAKAGTEAVGAEKSGEATENGGKAAENHAACKAFGDCGEAA